MTTPTTVFSTTTTHNTTPPTYNTISHLYELLHVAEGAVAAQFIRTVRVQGHQLQRALLLHCKSVV